MKAITICNPYPEMILNLEKPIENRSRHWSHRGQLFIHAGKSKAWMGDDDRKRFPNLSWGAIVGVMNVVACLELDSPKQWPSEYAYLRDHKHASGPWCLILTDVKRFEFPIECRGALGIWTVPPVLETLIREQMGQVSHLTRK